MAPRKQAIGGEEFTLEEEALIRQWIEYRHVVLNRLGASPNALSGVMQELNNELMNRTYLAGNKYSNADFEVFSGILPIYASQAIQMKEKYPHLSRWFYQVHYENRSNLPTPTTVSYCRTLLY